MRAVVRTVLRRLDVVDIFDEIVSFDVLLGHQRSVAEIMRHHDRWIQRSEIESGNWHVVVPFHWLDDSRTLVLLAVTT